MLDPPALVITTSKCMQRGYSHFWSTYNIFSTYVPEDDTVWSKYIVIKSLFQSNTSIIKVVQIINNLTRCSTRVAYPLFSHYFKHLFLGK
jgi:hypothetical protein